MVSWLIEKKTQGQTTQVARILSLHHGKHSFYLTHKLLWAANEPSNASIFSNTSAKSTIIVFFTTLSTELAPGTGIITGLSEFLL
jgi:hypothetical protein